MKFGSEQKVTRYMVYRMVKNILPFQIEKKYIRASAIGAGLGLMIWAIGLLAITVNSFYGRWYLMGYVYASPITLFFGF